MKPVTSVVVNCSKSENIYKNLKKKERCLPSHAKRVNNHLALCMSWKGSGQARPEQTVIFYYTKSFLIAFIT